jgi:hypothetical protein
MLRYSLAGTLGAAIKQDRDALNRAARPHSTLPADFRDYRQNRATMRVLSRQLGGLARRGIGHVQPQAPNLWCVAVARVYRPRHPVPTVF